MTDLEKARAAFEIATESYYEGQFQKYADGEYVTPQQQDDFTMFLSGYQAAKKEAAKEMEDAMRWQTGTMNGF